VMDLFSGTTAKIAGQKSTGDQVWMSRHNEKLRSSTLDAGKPD